MTYEEHVKQKLWDLWVKKSKRVEKHDQGWKKLRIRLGIGAGKHPEGSITKDRMLLIIQEFGIDMDMLDAMNPTDAQLYEIYHAINAYRISVRYLKKLKEQMSTFENFGGWRNEV